MSILAPNEAGSKCERLLTQQHELPKAKLRRRCSELVPAPRPRWPEVRVNVVRWLDGLSCAVSCESMRGAVAPPATHALRSQPGAGSRRGARSIARLARFCLIPSLHCAVASQCSSAKTRIPYSTFETGRRGPGRRTAPQRASSPVCQSELTLYTVISGTD